MKLERMQSLVSPRKENVHKGTYHEEESAHKKEG